MVKLSELLDAVVNGEFKSGEMCCSVVNTNQEDTDMCLFELTREIDCPECIFDKRGKPAVSKANKILITLKE